MADPQVLVVDDEEPVRRLLGRWIARWGYRVREAGDAAEALAAMEGDLADIMVIDVGMPGQDGLWLAEQVHARWPSTAIIMGTGIDESVIVRTSREIGAAAYVTKPFDPDLLRQAIDHAAGRLRFRPSAGQP